MGKMRTIKADKNFKYNKPDPVTLIIKEPIQATIRGQRVSLNAGYCKVPADPQGYYERGWIRGVLVTVALSLVLLFFIYSISEEIDPKSWNDGYTCLQDLPKTYLDLINYIEPTYASDESVDGTNDDIIRKLITKLGILETTDTKLIPLYREWLNDDALSSDTKQHVFRELYDLMDRILSQNY